MRVFGISRILRSLQYRYYMKFKYKSAAHFRDLVDHNIRKAIDIKWGLTYGKKFPWKNPVTLNEKITWLSSMTDTTEWTRLADKFEVREYVRDCGLGDILTKCYGVWDNVDDIIWDALPKQFVIKCTHDCGSTIIVKDKNSLNIEETKQFLKAHLARRMGYGTCEPHYTRIKPRIMAEELLPISEDGISSTLIDYKIWCLDGKATVAFVCYDRHLDSDKNEGHTVYDIYNIKDWKPKRDCLTETYKDVIFKDIPKPRNLDKMIEASERLAKGFPQVRIDLYNVNGCIYFGEMTFTSQGGRMSYFTPEYQKELGDRITLPHVEGK